MKTTFFKESPLALNMFQKRFQKFLHKVKCLEFVHNCTCFIFIIKHLYIAIFQNFTWSTLNDQSTTDICTTQQITIVTKYRIFLHFFLLENHASLLTSGKYLLQLIPHSKWKIKKVFTWSQGGGTNMQPAPCETPHA